MVEAVDEDSEASQSHPERLRVPVERGNDRLAVGLMSLSANSRPGVLRPMCFAIGTSG
jgi:hypothetical protein